ncbi:hypothetical protein [Nannocystis pusilla]|uniref:Transmembrane protein n=1 Tax=Nannocystis pusilla TaxID=889268 RepID=A0ABS7TKM2_9BACT|nr:hypothetical protein [Nannocystis pusilla]MBZ5708692.1 hypothetical protein [Nannocystis pusilla]
MSTSASASAWTRTRYLALVGAWAATVILAIRDATLDPPDPSRIGTAQYGHNSEGALAVVLSLTVLELAVALAILRPASYHAAWPRAAAAFLVFAAWSVASLLATMHAGGVVALHALWVMALALGCLVAMLWSLLARRK